MKDLEDLVVGSRFSVATDSVATPVVPGRPNITLSAGTRLELVEIDEQWDHTHAMILSTAPATADLRVLDGPQAGVTVRITLQDEFYRGGPTERRERPGFPAWLLPTPPGRRNAPSGLPDAMVGDDQVR
jgi:hypothetical protein